MLSSRRSAPYPLLDLTRIMSAEVHYKNILDAVVVQSSSDALCSISLNARSENDLLGMMQRLHDRVNFLHSYPAIGELKGIAKLRGIEASLSHPVSGVHASGAST